MHAILMKEVCMISHLDSVDYKAFIGLDWADDKHDVCVQDGLLMQNSGISPKWLSL